MPTMTIVMMRRSGMTTAIAITHGSVSPPLLLPPLGSSEKYRRLTYTLSSHTILTQYTQFLHHPHTVHSVLTPSSHCTLSSHIILTLYSTDQESHYTQFSHHPHTIQYISGIILHLVLTSSSHCTGYTQPYHAHFVRSVLTSLTSHTVIQIILFYTH